jgi:hypothetical protein
MHIATSQDTEEGGGKEGEQEKYAEEGEMNE